jgi:hypothetical protein
MAFNPEALAANLGLRRTRSRLLRLALMRYPLEPI